MYVSVCENWHKQTRINGHTHTQMEPIFNKLTNWKIIDI